MEFTIESQLPTTKCLMAWQSAMYTREQKKISTKMVDVGVV